MRASDYLTGPQISAVLRQAPALRRETGLPVRTIAAALGLRRTILYRWDAGAKPRDRAAAMRYVRVIAGLQRHCEIEETHEHWNWDWEHAGYRQPGSIAGRRDERAGPVGQGRRPG